MSNRSYFSNGAADEHHLKLESPKWTIPLFWLVPFAAEDLVVEDGDVAQLTCLSDVGLRRLRQRQDGVLECVGAEYRALYHQWIDLLERRFRPVMRVDLREILALSPGALPALSAALRDLSRAGQGAPVAATAELRDLTSLDQLDDEGGFGPADRAELLVGTDLASWPPALDDPLAAVPLIARDLEAKVDPAVVAEQCFAQLGRWIPSLWADGVDSRDCTLEARLELARRRRDPTELVWAALSDPDLSLERQARVALEALGWVADQPELCRVLAMVPLEDGRVRRLARGLARRGGRSSLAQPILDARLGPVEELEGLGRFSASASTPEERLLYGVLAGRCATVGKAPLAAAMLEVLASGLTYGLGLEADEGRALEIATLAALRGPWRSTSWNRAIRVNAEVLRRAALEATRERREVGWSPPAEAEPEASTDVDPGLKLQPGAIEQRAAELRQQAEDGIITELELFEQTTRLTHTRAETARLVRRRVIEQARQRALDFAQRVISCAELEGVDTAEEEEHRRSFAQRAARATEVTPVLVRSLARASSKLAGDRRAPELVMSALEALEARLGASSQWCGLSELRSGTSFDPSWARLAQLLADAKGRAAEAADVEARLLAAKGHKVPALMTEAGLSITAGLARDGELQEAAVRLSRQLLQRSPDLRLVLTALWLDPRLAGRARQVAEDAFATVPTTDEWLRSSGKV